MSSQSRSPVQGGEIYIHPNALCETRQVGAGTRVWAFAHILPSARIGKDCNICDGVFIENDVLLGDRVTVKCGVQLWDGLTLEDDAFVGPNATFTNDLFPRSRKYQSAVLRTVVCKNASVGANATILPGLTIGRNAMVGAGAVVTQSVPANAIVFGNPARIVGYVDAQGHLVEEDVPVTEDADAAVRRTGVKGVSLHRLGSAATGDRSSCRFGDDVPFNPNGYVMVSGAQAEKLPNLHARRRCGQFLVCLKGTCAVLADDGENRREITLDRPDLGLFLPAMTWSAPYRFSDDALLMILISGHDDDAIVEYEQFLREVGL